MSHYMISGNLGTYKIKWCMNGFLWKSPDVYEEVPSILWGTKWKKVWRGKLEPYFAVEQFLPEDLQWKGKVAVMAYEEWKVAWEKEGRINDCARGD